MSKDVKKKSPEHKPEVDASPTTSHCKFDACKKSVARFGFCEEHYGHYMAGVIRGDGKKPLDYEAKLAWYKANFEKVKKAA